MMDHSNTPCSPQISAIAAFAGLSVEVKEGTTDIVKTPTLTSEDGFSVFEASAIGRYSESYCPVRHLEKCPRVIVKILISTTR